MESPTPEFDLSEASRYQVKKVKDTTSASDP
jgi:hypothetical protein